MLIVGLATICLTRLAMQVALDAMIVVKAELEGLPHADRSRRHARRRAPSATENLEAARCVTDAK